MTMLAYALCALVAAACAAMLLSRARSQGSRMLFWSGMCFVLLMATNSLAAWDIAAPGYDLTLPRLGTALLAVCLLLYGLIFEDG